MIEEFGDFWEIKGDLRCITTNGALRKNGSGVMGKGLALQARERYPEIKLEAILGKMIRYHSPQRSTGKILYLMSIRLS